MKWITPKEPNNLRNRWRRYAAAMRGYGWCTLGIRGFHKGYGPNAYSADPWHANFDVQLIAPKISDSWLWS